MGMNKRITLIQLCIIALSLFYFWNNNVIGQENDLSEIKGVLTEQKTIAEGCVKEINAKYKENLIDMHQYNNGRHLYLFASGKFNGLISRLISDIEKSKPIYKADYINDINEAKERANNFILFVNDFYRGPLLLFVEFISNFNKISKIIENISNLLPSNKIEREKLIRDLNSLQWRTFNELSISS